jgi:RNA polymerase sigma-70 factor (ECF subfamily)
MGRFQLESAVQSAHAVRRVSGVADWAAIVVLYDALWSLTDSPVVAINRAVALAEVESAEAGLAALGDVADARMENYQPYWAARAALLARVGDVTRAGAAYDKAIDLERDPVSRAFLEQRRNALTA